MRVGDQGSRANGDLALKSIALDSPPMMSMQYDVKSLLSASTDAKAASAISCLLMARLESIVHPNKEVSRLFVACFRPRERRRRFSRKATEAMISCSSIVRDEDDDVYQFGTLIHLACLTGAVVRAVTPYELHSSFYPRSLYFLNVTPLLHWSTQPLPTKLSIMLSNDKAVL